MPPLRHSDALQGSSRVVDLLFFGLRIHRIGELAAPALPPQVLEQEQPRAKVEGDKRLNARFTSHGLSAARIGVLLLALAIHAPAQPAPQPTVTTQAIRIASEGARPPYNYLDNNELAGFEIDLGRELCARMKVACTFVVQDWDAMIPGLLDHQYDAIMAAMEITGGREAQIAFSKPYVRMPSAFMATKKNPIKDASPESLAGKTIGVEADGPHQAYAESTYKDSEIRRYATLQEAILDLAEGRIDVVLGDKDAVIDYLKNWKEAECCRLLANVPRDPAFFGEGIGIGLRKQDTALEAMFDKALDGVMADGTFAKIRAKYFDFEIN